MGAPIKIQQTTPVASLKELQTERDFLFSRLGHLKLSDTVEDIVTMQTRLAALELLIPFVHKNAPSDSSLRVVGSYAISPNAEAGFAKLDKDKRMETLRQRLARVEKALLNPSTNAARDTAGLRLMASDSYYMRRFIVEVKEKLETERSELLAELEEPGK